MSKKRGKKSQKGLVLRERPVAQEPEAAQNASHSMPRPRVPDNFWRKGLYWCLSAIFIALPLGLAPGNMNPYNKAFFMVVLAAAFGLIWLVTAINKKAVSLIYSPFFVALGLWLLAKIITTATSISPVKSFWGTYNSWSDGFVYGLAIATILVIIVTLVLEVSRIARLLNLLVAQATVLAAATIWQAVQAGFFYQKVRPDSPLLNADFFLSYGLLFLPLIVALLIWHIKRRRRLPACLYGLSALILSAALFVTLPTHLQTLILPELLSGKKDTTYGATDQKAIGAGNFTETNANLERWTEWKIGLTLGAQRPLVGTGPSTTGQAFILNKTRLDLTGWDNSHVMNHSHNDLIEQFSEEGLLGLASYLFLWGALAWILVKNWHCIDGPNRPYAWGLLGGLVLWLGFNLLLFTTVIAGLLAWVWIALLLTMVRSGRQVEVRRAQSAGRIFATSLALVLAVVGFRVAHYYMADAAVAHGMSINAGLTQGAYQSLTADDRVNLRLQAESEISGAADDIEFEDYYSNQAALTAIDTYFAVKFTNPTDAKLRTDNALHYAQQAAKVDPYSPENLQTLGGIQYYLAPAGSASEREGIALIDRAINLTPKSVAWYLNAAQIAALKKNYLLAQSYIKRGLAQTPKPSDHVQLEKLGRSYAQAQ